MPWDIGIVQVIAENRASVICCTKYFVQPYFIDGVLTVFIISFLARVNATSTSIYPNCAVCVTFSLGK